MSKPGRLFDLSFYIETLWRNKLAIVVLVSGVAAVIYVFVALPRQVMHELSVSSVTLSKLDTRADGLYVHFKYHAQIDPDVVFSVLNRLRLKSF